MHHRHAISKWIRIVTGAILVVAGASGAFLAWNAGHAQERYFRYKYGHCLGTRYEVPPINFSSQGADPTRLMELLEACKEAHDRYPLNYYFPSYVAHQALIAALMDQDEVAFRRHFGAAEHWCKIAFAINPYDIEICYIYCRILWEKGDRKAAIAFWKDTVVAREFWNPDLRAHLVSLCKRDGNYSLAAKEARFLRGRNASSVIHEYQKRRSVKNSTLE